MSTPARIVFATAMTLALAFGLLHHLLPEHPQDFDRLHVFLFNLCAGGGLLLHFTRGPGRLHASVPLYLVLALAYALSAYFERYLLTLLLSLPLLAVVEAARIERFSLLPLEFLRPAPVHRKFHQASLLCLSTGIAIAAAVILNEQYLHWLHMEMLTLDVFFLGYSFPISLVTLSILFSFMAPSAGPADRALRELCFWTITGGVVVFFGFILFELETAKLTISLVLSVAVCLAYWLLWRHGRRVQQWNILVSGMAFLLCTAITGVFYILQYLWPALEGYREYFLTLHATVSLYGWNLSGLFIIARWHDFPIALSSRQFIALHWATVFLLVPLGKFLPGVALVALPAFALTVLAVFFLGGRRQVPVP